MPKVLVFGAINMDLVMKTSQLPQAGETVVGASLSYAQGGKGANQAVAAARLGAPTKFLGAVGNDSFAASVVTRLEDAGVRSELQFADLPTGVAIVLVDAGGESSVLVDLGANKVFEQTGPPKVGEIESGDVVLIQNEIDARSNAAFADAARSAGARIVLNASPFSWDCITGLHRDDFLIVNEVEYAQFLGIHPATATTKMVEQTLNSTEFPTEYIVVTLGSEGVRARLGSTLIQKHGIQVNVVDTTGAGDCFCGAFAASLAANMDLAECVKFANAAAALSVQRLGAGPSMPHLSEVESLLRSMRSR